MIAMPFLLLSGIAGYCWYLVKVSAASPEGAARPAAMPAPPEES